MMDKPLALVIAAGVSIATLLSPVTVTADPAAPNVTGSSKSLDTVFVQAHLPGSPGAVTPVATKPTKKVTLEPTCQSFTVGSTGIADIACEAHQCPGGKQQYMRTVEDLQTGFKKFEHLCGLPDRAPDTLAIDQFHHSTVKVSTPTIAPKTTTLANFPNIYASDVKTYEEPTGITVANVRLKFIPALYRWNFGDGKTLTTPKPGRPWDPANEKIAVTDDIERQYDITHRYDNTGKFDITLTVVFNGQYSVNGAGWTDIVGSVQATSPPHTLTVYEARGELILPPGN